MDNSKQSKQVLLSVIGVAILVVAVVGVSFAFFNYTRAGRENSVSTGKIWFTSTQTNAMTIADFFPGANNGTTVQVHIEGGTTYTDGLTYRLRATHIQNLSAAVPIKVTTAAAAGGTLTTHGTFTPLTNVTLAENAILGTGTITGDAAATATWATGDIDVTGFIDPDVVISDTYPAEEATNDNTDDYLNGTTEAWRNGKTVVTTAQWNALATNPVTFRITVEAVEAGGRYVVS